MAYIPTPLDFDGSDADNLPSAGSKINTNFTDIQAMFDALHFQNAVLDKDLTAPPGGESEGDRYIVASTASGAWAGHEDDIAEYRSSAWVFITPVEGFTTWVCDEDMDYVFNGSSWAQK